MANVTAKTSSNIFYKARCEAATHNEQLSSREEQYVFRTGQGIEKPDGKLEQTQILTYIHLGT